MKTEPNSKCERCWGTGRIVDSAWIGRIAKRARIRRGWSIDVMARKLGISDSFLSLLERGKRGWSEELYHRMLKY